MLKFIHRKQTSGLQKTVSLHGAEVPGRPMREGARCAVIAKRHALANTKFCRHFVFSRNSDIPGSHLQSQYINIKQISFTLYVRLCRGEQNSSLYYIEEKKYEDICTIMDMNYQSVRNLMHRGITRLRELVG